MNRHSALTQSEADPAPCWLGCDSDRLDHGAVSNAAALAGGLQGHH